MKHVMLDLETFGTKPGSVLRSIGAVAFELTGETGAAFYANIDKQSCLDAGLTVDPATEELLVRHIARLERGIRATRTLLGGMSQDLLRSPASTFMEF